MLGDTIYSDSEVPGRLNPIALSVTQKWAKYKINLGNRSPARPARLRRLLLALGRPRVRERLLARRERVRQRRERSTAARSTTAACRRSATTRRSRWTRRDGLYRTVRWGRNLELFFLDERSFRSANADAGGVCNNPQTGRPDVAPTAPQTTRNLFALVDPVARAAGLAGRASTRSAARTGPSSASASSARFLRDVKRSNARFKVIMNEMPIQQYYVLPYDRWEGYEAERQQILRELQSVKNVIFLTTDVHATLVNDARFQTLEHGRRQEQRHPRRDRRPGGHRELRARDRPDAPGSRAAARSSTARSSRRRRPAASGMQCSILDQFSYGQVKVTRSGSRSRRRTSTGSRTDGRGDAVRAVRLQLPAPDRAALDRSRRGACRAARGRPAGGGRRARCRRASSA